jgi:hypothetical protein
LDNVPRVVGLPRVGGRRVRSSNGRKIDHLITGGHGRSLDGLIKKMSNVSGLGTGSNPL